MQLKYTNLEKYIKQHGNVLVESLRMEIRRNRENRMPINYTGELAESFTLVEERSADEYVVNITGLPRYKNLLPFDKGGSSSVVANVDDIFDWMVRKLGRPESEAADKAPLIVQNLFSNGYKYSSRVNFVSEAIEKKKEAFKPTSAIIKDIKEQILVILKEAGINTEGKSITIR
jgi:hypothetical protein